MTATRQTLITFLLFTTALAAGLCRAGVEQTDVWPSRAAACRAVVDELVSYLDELPGLSHRQVDVREGDRQERTRDAVLLVEQMLQKQGFKVVRGTVDLTRKPDGTFDAVSLVVTESEAASGGCVACQLAFLAERIFAARYVPKPWVENPKAYGDRRPEVSTFVGESGMCGGRAEAEQAALRAAREKLRNRIINMVSPETGRKLSPQALIVLDHHLDRFLEDQGGPADVFLQDINKPFGKVHRGWALLEVSNPELKMLADRAAARIRWHWLAGLVRVIIFAIVVIGSRIAANNVNYQTKGVFKRRVNAVNVVVIVAAAYLIFWLF